MKTINDEQLKNDFNYLAPNKLANLHKIQIHFFPPKISEWIVCKHSFTDWSVLEIYFSLQIRTSLSFLHFSAKVELIIQFVGRSL